MNNQILVIAAHSDDETLGCGGTIVKHINDGDQVTVMFMTDGVSSRETEGDENFRVSASNQAMEILGVKDIRQSDFPDNKMDSVTLLDIVKVIELVIDDIKPNIVYTHYRHDLNIDHQITHQAVMTACRPQSWLSVKEIYTFEVLSSTEWNSRSLTSFTPQKIVNITDFWSIKVKALECYSKEMRSFPHSRSYECVEALAILRGATFGLNKAEAFTIERLILD